MRVHWAKEARLRSRLSVCAGILSFVLLLLAPAGARAQPGIAGPPTCPLRRDIPVRASVASQPAVGFHPVEPQRPSAEKAREIAEQEAADATVLAATEPFENFGVARYRLRDYGDCVGTNGCYWLDLDAQLRRAQEVLRSELAQGEPVTGQGLGLPDHSPDRSRTRPALVLDIDETTLSSYCEMKVEDFGYIPELFNSWVVTPEAAVGIPGTRRLFDQARAAGIAIFFVTGRPEEQRTATERNLHAAGFSGWTGLILRSQAEKSMPTVAYKSSERAKIVASGYRLVLSVGDQWSDLRGEPKAERSVKLPNPFYDLP